MNTTTLIDPILRPIEYKTPLQYFHVLLLEGQSQYGANNRFTQDLAAAFKARGHHVSQVHFNAPNFNQLIIQALQGDPNKPVNLIISFNGITKELVINDKIVCDLLNVPCINYFLDHPMKQAHRVDMPVAQYINTYVDEAHIPFAKKILAQHFQGISSCLKHAGAVVPEAKPIGNYEQRTNTILVSSSYKPFDFCWGDLQFQGCGSLPKLLQALVEVQIADPLTPMGERFISAFEQAGMQIARLNKDFLDHLFVRVERCVEMYFREQYMKAAATAELPLMLAGNGWDLFKNPSKHWQIVGAKPFDWLLETLPTVKLLWSQVYCFTHGAHERIFYAQANGTAVACDNMPWLAAHYKDGQSALLLDAGNFEAGVNKLSQWLQQPAPQQEALAKAGQSICIGNHTWDARVLEIEQLVQHYEAYETLRDPKAFGLF